MKSALAILMICFVFVACAEEIEPLKALQKGMPNTVTLSNGEVVYKMDGEWDAAIDWSHPYLIKDIIEIKQEGNKFVGVFLKGNEIKGAGAEVIKGELEKNGFISLSVNTPDGWLPAKSKIDSDCNKIKTETETKIKTLDFTLKLTLTRK